MRKQKGFSLIELLIVVAIILIIAAIAIPNLLAARRSANESSAVGSLRTINTSEVSLQAAKSVYTGRLADLGPAPTGMGYLDQGLADADTAGANIAKSGYLMTGCIPWPAFAVVCGAAAVPATFVPPPAAPLLDYTWGADPASAQNGNGAFCTSTDGVVGKDPAAQPGVTQGKSANCAAQNPLVPVG